MGFRDTLKKWDAEKAKAGEVDLPPAEDLIPAGQRTVSVPPKDQRALRDKIQRGMLPEKSKGQMAIEAIGESNTAAGQALMDQTLWGLPGKAARALGIYGKPVAPVDSIVNESNLASLPAAAFDMATMGGALGKAGEAIGQAPQMIARKLGMSEAKTAVRPTIQTMENAAASGSIYGGLGGAARNENLSELPADVSSGMIEGAAGNALMSSVPVGFSALKNAGERAIVSRAVRPLVGIGQGVKADKALAGLGKGDVELGEKEMRRVIEQEGLAPVINSKSTKMQKTFDAKLEEVWTKELGPIRAKALAVEPDAKVQVRQIEERLRALVGKDQAGTDVHDDVEKAIAMLKERAEKIGDKRGFPVQNLLKNAQEFERDGFGKSQPKFADGQTARAIGKELRALTDERLAKIYAKNPKVVREMLGMKEPDVQPKLLETGADNPDYVAPRLKKPWEMTDEDVVNLGVLGEAYQAARKRYADLKKLEPLIEQLAKRRAEQRPGLINTLKRAAGNVTAGMLGYGTLGGKGILPAMLAAEGARLGAPLAERATAAVGRFGAGNAVDPRLAGAIMAEKKEPK